MIFRRLQVYLQDRHNNLENWINRHNRPVCFIWHRKHECQNRLKRTWESVLAWVRYCFWSRPPQCQRPEWLTWCEFQAHEMSKITSSFPFWSYSGPCFWWSAPALCIKSTIIFQRKGPCDSFGTLIALLIFHNFGIQIVLGSIGPETEKSSSGTEKRTSIKLKKWVEAPVSS